jgi:haloacetate dehalogenase
MMFEGYERADVDVADDVRIHFRHGGTGPPLLLLHGNPMTHVAWHKLAGPLAERFTVVAPDLRGYGDSSAPEAAPDHSNYSFRAMAQDQVALMAHLGHDRFAVAGQDRGARVVHRLCLDHPERVSRAAVLDIVPTEHMYANTSKEWAERYWHWPFMSRPADLPERLMGSVPAEWFLRAKMGRDAGDPGCFDEEAFAEYVRCFNAKTIRGSCEDYRAAATIDLELDRADLHRRVDVPLLVLWGAHSNTQKTFGDLLPIWREGAVEVTGGPLDCGHYISEEAPEGVLEAFEAFFGAS